MKQRVRLWLRGERAFGLQSSVALPRGCAERDQSVGAEAESRFASEVLQEKSDPFEGIGQPNEMAPMGGLVAPPSVEPFTAAPLAPDEKRRRLIALDNNEVRGCTRCRLCETRTNTVFGDGDADAKVFFIGEGPGENEDLQGRPFVGRAGEKLNDMIAGMGLRRDQVYIANIVKCRPPGNREPAPDEVATCTPYLERQLEIIRPRVIVTLGRPSSQYMLQSKQSMGRLRGNWHAWRGIKLMPTYHPAYILRNYTKETRAAVWSDLQLVMKELGLAVPARKS